MHIVIVGCGRVGSELAILLDRAGRSVAVIDRERSALHKRLGEGFGGRLVPGSGFERDSVADAGVPGVGTGEYYLMPASLRCLQDKVKYGRYPYTNPPASRAYEYTGDACPNAQRFLKTFIRWTTFNEKYQAEHCELAANIVRQVAEKCRV